jgi:hypothetical protein
MGMTCEEMLATLYSWLGPKTVLLPIPLGTKKPDWQDWQRTTFEQTQTPQYQERLMSAIKRGGNVGVLLGDGLVSIDIDDDDRVEEFVSVLNPQFAETLQSRGYRGRNIWLRIEGEYPQQVYKLKTKDGKAWGEWRGGGGSQTVIFGQHPNGTPDKILRYSCVSKRPTMRSRPEDIVWPDNIILPWLAPKTKPQPTTLTVDVTADLDKRIQAYLAAIPPAVELNGGDLQTFTVACALVHGFALSTEQARSYLEAYSARCEPPWSEKELLHKLAKAVTAPHEKPRGHLLESNVTFKNSPNSTNSTVPTTEAVTIVEEPIDWDNSTNSTNSPGYPTQKGYIQECIYPEDSVISDFMDLGREVCESAEVFLLGSCISGVSASLERRIRFPFGAEIHFPNLFSMIAGPPGTRKSSGIDLARQVMKEFLPNETFMPKRFSVETLFDEYDQKRGGCPDKWWVYDDAKPILTDWKKTGYGERVAAEVLDLYACTSMTENFRRNSGKKNPQTRRHIPQTSTSILFGATFPDASFPGQAVQSGVARRFINYVGEDMGRERALPPVADLKPVSELFSRLRRFQSVCSFTEEAEALWITFQHDNRVRIRNTDARCEVEVHRLNSAPMQTLHVAMCFEACIAAKKNLPGFDKISMLALNYAIDHVDACLEAAKYLDSVSSLCATLNNAEVLLAKVRKDFRARAKNEAIILTRSEITGTYASHPNRADAWTPDIIFLRLIPALIRERMAKQIQKRSKGQPEIYAFRCE